MQNVEEKNVESTHEWREGSCLSVPALDGFIREVAPFSEFGPISHSLFILHLSADNDMENTTYKNTKVQACKYIL
jgi:hypothetical protein